MNTLTYAGTNLNTFGVWFDSSRKYKKPAKRFLGFDVPARNGNLYASEHKFDNVVIEYRCYIEKDFATNYNNLVNFLNSFDTYQVLENSVDSTVYRMALFHEELSVDTGQFLKDGQFSLFFDCKPQEFLKTGDVEQNIQPSTETKTGNPVIVENPYGWTSLTALVADIQPKQSGSGDPAPDNVRPITGTTEVNVTITGGSTYNTDLGTTVYGGSLNVTTGVLTIDRLHYTMTGDSSASVASGMKFSKSSSPTNNIYYTLSSGGNVTNGSGDDVVLSSHFVNQGDTPPRCYVSSNQFRVMLPMDSSIQTANDMNTWVAQQYANGTPLEYCVKLITPTTVQLTPQQISLLTGTNELTCDSGDMTITLAPPFELENPSYMESKPIFKLDNETSIMLNGETIITYPSVLAVTDKTTTGQGYQIKASGNEFTISGNVPAGTYDFPCTLLPEGTYKFYRNIDGVICTLIINNGTNRTVNTGETFTIADDDVSMSVRIAGNITGSKTFKPVVTLGAVYVDCELMDCYLEDGTNANPYVQLTDGFITIPRGESVLETDRTQYIVATVKPRWWRL